MGGIVSAIRDKFPETFYQRLTLGLVFVQAVVIVALEAVVASLFIRNISMVEDTPAKGVPVYLVMFCLSQVFNLAICWDAIWHKNSIQLYGFLVFNACCFAYALFQYWQLESLFTQAIYDNALEIDKAVLQKYGAILIVIPTVLALFEAVFVWLAFKLTREFGWKMYKRIGADPHMRYMYRWYQIFLMLVKFDLFFALTFSIQFLVLQLNPGDYEFWLTIVALPVAIVFSFAAIWGAKRENKPMSIAFMVLLVATLIYFVFKIVRMYQPDQRYKYLFTYKYLTFFAVICIVVGVAVLVAAIIVYRNFGEGLAKHLNSADTLPRSATLKPDSKPPPNPDMPNPYDKKPVADEEGGFSSVRAGLSNQGVFVPEQPKAPPPAAVPPVQNDGGGVDYNTVVASLGRSLGRKQ